ncbi:carboxylesterase/lipase family protein [Hyalangium versicolor]|uniref:carboxylesterase/lipase family protein n=1 Tax=Hyalangium versicolor TaxID=2861190 RepID=UPI001CCEF456|nr:carboxylesterase family protein [Hyalangium versicolor]
MPTQTPPLVQTVEGPVQGAIIEPGVAAYMGIPYAASPVGNLRWRAPQPVTPWTQTRPSNDQAPSCLQNRNVCIEVGGGDPHPMSEDCLYLNVWTPQPKEGAPKLPVMVWIHGGAYILGAGRLPIYHGAPFVNRGAILVTINYRMGALGFFAHPSLEKEVTVGQKRIYNFGLLDQIAALEWVQRNIEKFGGNPNNVTIFGQSAGARSVLALFASPLTQERERPLFHRGIAQSVYRAPEASREKALERGNKLAEVVLGLGKGQGATATLEQLRGVEAGVLMNVPIDPAKDFKGTANSPVGIAGDIVLPGTDGIIERFEKGEVAALPLIIGNTSDDGSVVLDQLQGNPSQIVTLAVTTTQVKRPKLYYPDLAEQASPDQNELGRRLARDAYFTAATYRIAKAHSKRAPTWRYYFDYTAENHRPSVTKGTRHGDEVAFTMDTLKYAPPFPPGQPQNPVTVTTKDYGVASSISERWFNFASTPEPSPEWPRQSAEADKTLLVGESLSVATDFMQQHHKDAELENMDAFNRIGTAMDTLMASLG